MGCGLLLLKRKRKNMMVVAKGTWVSISFKIKAEVGKSCTSH